MPRADAAPRYARDMGHAIVTGIFGLGGALLGAAAALGGAVLAERRAARRALAAAAVRALARLEKIRTAEQAGNTEQRDREIHYLGEHELDAYVEALAAAGRAGDPGLWSAYEAMLQTVIRGDTARLDEARAALHPLRGSR
jgi:hypothetical protein